MKPSIFITRKLPDEIVAPLKEKFTVRMWDSEDVAVTTSRLAGRNCASGCVMDDDFRFDRPGHAEKRHQFKSDFEYGGRLQQY